MYSKDEFKTKLESLFGTNFTSDERLDMIYNNYIFIHHICGVSPTSDKHWMNYMYASDKHWMNYMYGKFEK